ncbi:hypothetical protein [uncultured Shimia sp.]|uniref:hypothetical protein n=1 Tax=uncultured Shimia sp. TaxID=573152 RepID=UPI0025D326E1|nr:hypothetical protein [uncultured Shimia sp.]
MLFFLNDGGAFKVLKMCGFWWLMWLMILGAMDGLTETAAGKFRKNIELPMQCCGAFWSDSLDLRALLDYGDCA